MDSLIVWLYLMAGNFIFQLLNDAQAWSTAAEHSFFQGGAIVALAVYRWSKA